MLKQKKTGQIADLEGCKRNPDPAKSGKDVRSFRNEKGLIRTTALRNGNVLLRTAKGAHELSRHPIQENVVTARLDNGIAVRLTRKKIKTIMYWT